MSLESSQFPTQNRDKHRRYDVSECAFIAGYRGTMTCLVAEEYDGTMICSKGIVSLLVAPVLSS